MTRDALQTILQQPYERARWLGLMRHVFPTTEVFATAQPVPTADTGAQSIAHLARASLDGGKRIAVLEVRVAERIDLLRNRVGLRNLVARFIDQAEFHGVLAIFISADSDYRFTFASRVSEFDTEGNLTQKETAPRRYTYILGPNESCRTAGERFEQLAARGGDATLADVVGAFSVEKLNKEFFADFCRAFDHVSKDIRKHHPKWSDADVEREAQTLLDRLVFLYFVQRKGWLNRQRDYLFRHFREPHEGKPGSTFMQQFLRPLFAKFSTEGSQADIAGHDLPFLNGGLFNDEYGDEQSDESTRRRFELLVANDTFAYVFENLLERYNFTIHEDSPTNQEVAIDPEMLGKIFEALVLQIEQSTTGGKSLRHDTGSHYTPRPIVHYLCVAALAGWLENQPPFSSPSPPSDGGEGRGEGAARSRITRLLSLDASEGLNDDERATLNACLTPEEATVLIDRLSTLRACDPAVGSGAFPMGLLRELLNLARLCETRARGQDPVDGDRAWLYETKKRIIERVIYGVDLQERAIEICKLRLWLSLMVDHDLGVDPANCDARSFRRALGELEPLPNLDFKIRRADSLVDKIHGQPVVLSALSRETGAALPLSRLTTAKREFFAARTAAIKRKLRFAIYESLTELAKIELTRARTDAAGFGLALDDASAARVAELDHGLKEIAFIAAQVRDARKLRAASQDEALERIRARFDDPQKPTFVWQLDFAEVFHRGGSADLQSAVSRVCNPLNVASPSVVLSLPAPSRLQIGDTADCKSALQGFDIVMGNPPYVRIQVLNQSAPEAAAWYKGHYAAAAKGSYDLYVVFVERGLQLLAPGGQLAYIVPHKFFNAQYGQPLRALLAGGRHLRHVVHFGDQQIFPGATNYVCLLFLAQSGADACRWVRADNLPAWLAVQRAAEGVIPAKNVTAAEWNFAVGKGAGLFDKLKAMPVKLGDVANLFVGLQTDADDVFILELVSQTKKELRCFSKFTEREHRFEAGHLKPFLKGALNIRRFALTDLTKRLIFPYETRDEVSVLIPPKEYAKRFPLTWAYLSECKPRLSKRAGGGLGDEWHGYIYKKNHTRFEQPKLLAPAIAAGACFAADLEGHFHFVGSGAGGGGGYGITPKISFSLSPLYLLGVLNSQVSDYFLRKVSTSFRGGYIALTRQFIEHLPIPLLNLSNASERAEHDALVALVERVLAAKRAHPPAATAPLEREIDERVHRLYALTPEEIKLVEESGK